MATSHHLKPESKKGSKKESKTGKNGGIDGDIQLSKVQVDLDFYNSGKDVDCEQDDKSTATDVFIGSFNVPNNPVCFKGVTQIVKWSKLRF